MYHVLKIIQIILTRCISSTMRYETWKFLSITQFISEKRVYIISFKNDILLYYQGIEGVESQYFSYLPKSSSSSPNGLIKASATYVRQKMSS